MTMRLAGFRDYSQGYSENIRRNSSLAHRGSVSSASAEADLSGLGAEGLGASRREDPESRLSPRAS